MKELEYRYREYAVQNDTFQPGRLLARLCASRYWLAAVAFLVIFLGGIVTTLRISPVYQASTSILVTPVNPNIDYTGDLLSDVRMMTQQRTVDTQVVMLGSDALLREALRIFTPEQRLRYFGGKEVSGDVVQVEARKNTDLITITTEARAPDAAAQLADSIASTYLARASENHRAVYRQARTYLAQYRAQVQRRLDQVTGELTAATASTARQHSPVPAMAVQRLREDLDAARVQAAGDRRMLQQLRGQLAREQQMVTVATSIAPNPEYNQVQQRIDALRSEGVELEQEYTADSDEVNAHRARIAAEEQRRATIRRNSVAGETIQRNPLYDSMMQSYLTTLATHTYHDSRITALSSMLRTAQRQTGQMTARNEALAMLRHQQEALRAQETALQRDENQLLLQEQSPLSVGSVVGQAVASSEPVRPRTTTALLFFGLLGVLCATVIIKGAGWLLERSI